MNSRHQAQALLLRCRITGQVFFVSAERFVRAFDFKETAQKVRLDVSHAHFWDITAVGALDKVVEKFRRAGVQVEVTGMNEASATMVDQSTGPRRALGADA